MSINRDQPIAKKILVISIAITTIAAAIGVLISFAAAIMKLNSEIDWTWWQILMPFIMPFAFEGIVSVITVMVLMCEMVKKEKCNGE